MSTCIIGAGLAGLTSAIKIKLKDKSQQVLVVEKSHPESNTQIAGLRFRDRISGSQDQTGKELVELLAQRNEGTKLPQMERFVKMSRQELNFWQQISTKNGDCLNFEDRPKWFGPRLGWANQMGKGRGLSVLKWLRNLANEIGVEFYQGEALKLIRQQNLLEGVLISKHSEKPRLSVVHADNFVLAGGSLGGSLFLSTNKVIHHSPQELAYEAGLDLIDGSVHMIHPFGFCDQDGNPRVGCFETDELALVKVYLGDGSFDKQTTELLHNHKAHYAFDEIAARFVRYGSIVALLFPDGSLKKARVSHHYSQLGLDTDDGISVRNMDNLFAVGDASSIGYWTGHRIRLPGFALSKCLVDAELLGEVVSNLLKSDHPFQIENADQKDLAIQNMVKEVRMHLQETNTQQLLQMMFSESTDEIDTTGKKWIREVLPFKDSTLGSLSLGVAFANWAVRTHGRNEPFPISQETLAQIRHEGLTEIRSESVTPFQYRL